MSMAPLRTARALGLVADGDQAGLVGRDDELGAGGAVELAEQGVDVGFDGGLADSELVGDVGVGAAAGDGDEDLAFTLGQARDGTGRTATGSGLGCAAAGGPRAPLTDDDAGDLRVEDLLAGAHAVHGRDERRGLGVR